MAKDHFGEVHREVELTLKRLASVLERQGKFAEAETVWREELLVQRKLSGEEHVAIANSLEDLGVALLAQNKLSEAAEVNRQALEMGGRLARNAAASSDPDVLDTAAWFLATCDAADIRNGKLAVELAMKAVQATHRKNPFYLDTLAGTYAEVGQFEMAVKFENEAIALPAAERHKAEWRTRLQLYLAGKPYRESRFDINAANVASWLAMEVLNLLKTGKAIGRKHWPASVWLSAKGAFPTVGSPATPAACWAAACSPKKVPLKPSHSCSPLSRASARESAIPPAGKARIRRLYSVSSNSTKPPASRRKAAQWNKKLAEFDQVGARGVDYSARPPSRQAVIAEAAAIAPLNGAPHLSRAQRAQ